MFFKIKVYSKSKFHFKKFLTFVNLLKTKTPIALKQISSKKSKKFLSVLKSPHVNKTAQKQFEFLIYSQSFNLTSIRNLLFFIYLKKLKSFITPGFKIQVTGILNENSKKKNSINPKKIHLNFFKPDLNITRLESKVSNYFQLFDIFGEITLKNSHLQKS